MEKGQSLEKSVDSTQDFLIDFEKSWKERKIKDFLKEKGFKAFTSDGNYFVDEQGNKYGAWGALASLERKERIEGGENRYWVSRGVREIKPEEDIFNLLWDKAYCWIGRMQSWDDINFVSKIPLPTQYNAAVITPIPSWREEGQDGGGQKTLYSLLMLKYEVTRKTEFVKDLTEEEKRLRDIELFEEPF